MIVPNRPKARAQGRDLIEDAQRRRRLGLAFTTDQSLDEALEYDAARPRYPRSVVDDILGMAGRVNPCVVELGAGTGILTRAFLARGADVHAVEPSVSMTEVLRRREVSARGVVQRDDVPQDCLKQDRVERDVVERDHVEQCRAGQCRAAQDCFAEDGEAHVPMAAAAEEEVFFPRAVGRGALRIDNHMAEHTAAANAAADLVVAAQAWHWFDPETIQAELRRVLKPGGAVAVVGNYLDTSQPWVHRLTRIMRAGDVYRPQWKPRLEAQYFAAVETQVSAHSREITPQQILRLATTLSSWLSANDADRARRAENLTWYLLDHLGHDLDEKLQLPYLTSLHTSRLKILKTQASNLGHG